MIRYLFLLVRILLVMLQVDVTVVVRHLLLGLTVCLQDLFFVAVISVATPSWPDLCGDHRSLASRDRWLSSPSLPCSAHAYALQRFKNGFALCCWTLLSRAPTCAFLHCSCPAQCPRRIPSFNTPPTQRVSLAASRCFSQPLLLRECHSLFRAATPPPWGVLLAGSPPHSDCRPARSLSLQV